MKINYAIRDLEITTQMYRISGVEKLVKFVSGCYDFRLHIRAYSQDEKVVDA